jgi:hypothetical protein
MDPGEGDGGADPQSPLSRAGSARGELGLSRFLEGPPGALEITEPCFRRGESARRAGQQLDAEILLELRDRLRDRRLPNAKLPGRSGEGPVSTTRTKSPSKPDDPSLFSAGMSDIAPPYLPCRARIDHLSLHPSGCPARRESDEQP